MMCSTYGVFDIRVMGFKELRATFRLRTDAGMYLHAGPEIGVASTKAFTCQARRR
jgi:glucosamine 6-phosphate synthetase-like amidotransferase/phosphosugar isomerase protein